MMKILPFHTQKTKSNNYFKNYMVMRYYNLKVDIISEYFVGYSLGEI